MGDSKAGRGRASFWFGAEPPHRLAVFRAGFGALVAIEAGWRVPYSRELFSSEGFHIGYLAHLAPPPALALMLSVGLVAAAANVAIGSYTRPSLVVMLALWGFLYAIDQVNEKAISTIVLVVGTVLLFSQCAETFSLDARRRASRGQPLRTEVSVFPVRLLQLEVANIYFFAGVVKLVNPEWVNGTVLYRVLASRWASEAGVWVSGWLPPLAVRAGGLGTILYELLAGFLLFSPWARRWVLLIGAVFHLSIQLLLEVESLGFHFLWMLGALFATEEAPVAAWLRRWLARVDSVQRIDRRLAGDAPVRADEIS
jgi:hypothetical protein